jgi:hypothetical protein
LRRENRDSPEWHCRVLRTDGGAHSPLTRAGDLGYFSGKRGLLLDYEPSLAMFFGPSLAWFPIKAKEGF